MTTPIDTPRSDSVMIDPMRDGNDLPNLARQLERELSAANAKIETLVEAGDAMFDVMEMYGEKIRREWTKAKEGSK